MVSDAGNLVLLHDTQRMHDISATQKLRYRWCGPYRIRSALGNSAYTLEELDGTFLTDFFTDYLLISLPFTDFVLFSLLLS
jgi:hypothetical protein